FDADDPRQTPDKPVGELGRKLARAVRQPVYRPTELDVPNNVTFAPTTALPLRSDRDTIYLTHSMLPADMTIAVRGDDQTLSFNLAAATEGPNDSFLAVLDERVSREGGLSNSLAGTALLDVAQNEISGRIAGLVGYGKIALARKDLDRVQQAI